MSGDFFIFINIDFARFICFLLDIFIIDTYGSVSLISFCFPWISFHEYIQKPVSFHDLVTNQFELTYCVMNEMKWMMLQ